VEQLDEYLSVANSAIFQIKHSRSLSKETTNLLKQFSEADWVFVTSSSNLSQLTLGEWQFLLQELQSVNLADYLLNHLLSHIVEQLAKETKVNEIKGRLSDQLSSFIQSVMEYTSVIELPPHKFRKAILLLDLNKYKSFGKTVELELGKYYANVHYQSCEN